MTEADWDQATEPHVLLEFVRAKGLVRPRKHRLFAVACSRRVWPWIDPLGQAAVEMAERFADGQVDADALRAARLACQGAGGQASWYAAATNPEIAARNAARSAQAGAASNGLIGSETAELHAQAALVRDIYGPLPFQSITLDPAWFTPAVIQQAHALYEDRAFEQMPNLADALHAAGCQDPAILNHCRAAGPHVRGCFVLDLLLRRE